jgi:hypothetical protein
MTADYSENIVQLERSAKVQSLPFRIRIARSESDLQLAVQIRHAAYARHVPVLAAKLAQAEPADLDASSVVLVAVAKLDEEPLGTMRIHLSRCQPLPIEKSVALPPRFRAKSLAEATRLGVAQHRVGRVVKTLLFKAFYEYCVLQDVDYMVVGGRAPLDRQYEALLFEDVFPGRGFIPLAHAGHLPHRILAFDVRSAEERWRAASHPLYDLVFRTRHPDLALAEAGERVRGAVKA